MYRRLIIALGATLALTAGALADPIEGTYKSSVTGETVKIAPCGAGFCMTYMTGPHKGKQSGSFKPNGNGGYQGTVIDLNDGGKKYSGKGSMSGKNFVAGGCVLGGLICRNATYTRM